MAHLRLRTETGSRLRSSALAVALGWAILGGLLASPAFAIPSLQLDIQGGVWDPVTQTVIATSDSFRVYAYLIPASGALLTDNYFISAAVVPRTGPADAALGSFTFNSTNINVTSDMYFGDPPVESIDRMQPRDPGDLPTHGIFETYFSEFRFAFNSANRATAYNTQDTPGVGPTVNSSGTMYFAAFDVDVASLAQDHAIHFDLYDESILTKLVCTGTGRNKTCTSTTTDIDVNSFAPFSHDAQSGSRRQVPEPSSLVLAGLGLVAVAGFAIRSRRP